MAGILDDFGGPGGPIGIMLPGMDAFDGLELFVFYDVEPFETADDGGDRIEVPGPWLEGRGHTVLIEGLPCYSGRAGEGYSPVPHAGVLRFIIPPDLPLGGPYDIVIEWPIGDEVLVTDTVTLEGLVTVRRRHRREATYALARLFPPGAYDRGPINLDQGTLLEPSTVDPALTNMLRAFLGALGQTFNDLGGMLFTRLVADLPPAQLGTTYGAASTRADVETTFGAPEEGTILIGGEAIPYTSTTATRFVGLTRDDAVSETYRAGEPVAFYNRDRSALERARRGLLVSTAEGAYLDMLGRNVGVPRYLGAGSDDDLYRRMIEVLGYQAGRGSPSAIGEFLDVLLAETVLAGVDGEITDAVTIEAASAPFTARMVGLRIELYNDPAQTYRIAVFDSATEIKLDPDGSTFWRGVDFTAPDTGIPWRIVPWDVLPDPWRPGIAVIRINAAPAETSEGFAYLQGGEQVEPDDANTVTVAYEIRQVLGVWRLTDPYRRGTNYATDNNFSGNVITLSSALPDGNDVIVDYGSVEGPTSVETGVPGAAYGPGTAQLMKDATWRNPGTQGEITAEGYAGKAPPIIRYPLYLGDRLGQIPVFLEVMTIAGVRPLVELYVW